MRWVLSALKSNFFVPTSTHCLSWSHRVVCREFFVSLYAISRLYLAQLTTQLISNEQAGQRRHKHEVSFESSQSPAKNVNYTNYCQPRRRAHESLKTIFQDSSRKSYRIEWKWMENLRDEESKKKVTISCDKYSKIIWLTLRSSIRTTTSLNRIRLSKKQRPSTNEST